VQWWCACGSFSVNANKIFDMRCRSRFEINLRSENSFKIQEWRTGGGYASERPCRVKSRLEPLDGGPRSSEAHLFLAPSVLNGILVGPSLTFRPSKAYSCHHKQWALQVSRDANRCCLRWANPVSLHSRFSHCCIGHCPLHHIGGCVNINVLTSCITSGTVGSFCVAYDSLI
jgi:hypothetical protein